MCAAALTEWCSSVCCNVWQRIHSYNAYKRHIKPKQRPNEIAHVVWNNTLLAEQSKPKKSSCSVCAHGMCVQCYMQYVCLSLHSFVFIFIFSFSVPFWCVCSQWYFLCVFFSTEIYYSQMLKCDACKLSTKHWFHPKANK